MRLFWRCVFVVAMAGSCAAYAVEPQLKWSHHAESNLYAPPLVAEVVSSAPGKEIILSDSETRRVCCLDAKGAVVWGYKGDWAKRLTSSAALSASARPGKTTLAIGNPDGKLCCLDAETGQELWQRTVGNIEWGACVWADVNGDGRDELVAGTLRSGVVTLDADGNPLWTYGGEGGKSVYLRCPIAAADIDGDHQAEIFAAGAFGPFCLNGDGTVRWDTLLGDDVISTVVIADADVDGAPELYCSSRNDNAVCCVDARSGTVRWKVGLMAGTDTYSGSSFAIGDSDQDGRQEIFVSDAEGEVYCLSCSGEVRWIFTTEKPVHAAITLGDVDGDRAIEVLAACGDHYLYCLDANGRQKWRCAADLRLISAATIADVDNDGKTEILFGGSDKTLRCLTLEGRYDARLTPWPSRRFDAAQCGSSLGAAATGTDALMEETAELLTFGGFELPKEMLFKEKLPEVDQVRALRTSRPRGWVNVSAEEGTWGLDTETKLNGASSLKVAVGTPPVTVIADPVKVDASVHAVSARVAVNGDGCAALRWIGAQGVVREEALSKGAELADGWSSLIGVASQRPCNAQWVQLVLRTNAGTAWWDEAALTATVRKPRTLRALVNQVGYETGAPKRFTAQSNFIAKKAEFVLVNDQEAPVFTGTLTPAGRIHGAYGEDWGNEYWRGDFSTFNTPGAYTLQVVLDGVTDTSWPFEIGDDLLWEKTARLAYRFFYYQRCGMAIPGFHGACHLDDAVSADGKRQYTLWGGWHDAGDYNTYDNVPYVLGLVTAYGVRKDAFDRQDEDQNGVGDFLDEILWGGEHTRRMIAPDGSAYGEITAGYEFWGPAERETDNIPGTGDERPIRGMETGNDASRHAAAMAKIATYVSDKAPWVEAAQRALEWALKNNKRGPLPFAAAVNLYAATQDEKYAALAKDWFPGPDLDVIEAVQTYDELFHEDHAAALKAALTAKAEELLALSQNPFGVYTFGPVENPNFFETPKEENLWHVGGNSHLLEAAALAAKAYQYNPDPRYLAFVYDQLNWVLGNNPFALSLMEGAGHAFLPTYHHRCTFAGIARGAAPGGIVNGVTWRHAGKDVPYLDVRGLDIPDFESNEVWLPHNTAYLKAISNLAKGRAMSK
jgi:outer membrane protein assembly factor BamB